MEIDSSYNKFLTPPLPADAKSEKLTINSSVQLQSLDSFNSIEGKFSVKFTVVLQWFDGRLLFNNLRTPPDINTLQPNEVGEIWFP